MWCRSPLLNSRTAFCWASAEKLPTDRSVSERWSRMERSQAYLKARTAKSSDAWRAAIAAANSPSAGGVQGRAQPVQLGELGQRSPVGVELLQRVLAVPGPHPGQAGQR